MIPTAVSTESEPEGQSHHGASREEAADVCQQQDEAACVQRCYGASVVTEQGSNTEKHFMERTSGPRDKVTLLMQGTV